VATDLFEPRQCGVPTIDTFVNIVSQKYSESKNIVSQKYSESKNIVSHCSPCGQEEGEGEEEEIGVHELKMREGSFMAAVHCTHDKACATYES
jgi:hypothetical protein